MPGAKATAPELQNICRLAVTAMSLVVCFALAGCTTRKAAAPALNLAATTQESDETAALDDKPEGKTARAYKVAGSSSAIESFEGYSAEGLSSWYGTFFHGRTTANGEVFDKTRLSAAHPSMPLPSYARVTNTGNGKSVIVRVNDRGPFHGNRALDVSERTADLLGFKNQGMARIRIDYVGPASLEGSDDARLMASYRENGDAPAGVMLASLPPQSTPRAAPIAAPAAASSTVAAAPPKPAPPVPAGGDPEPATTPVDVASRIQTSFGSMNTPPPIQGNQRPQMVQPVLSGFAFEPSTFTAPR